MRWRCRWGSIIYKFPLTPSSILCCVFQLGYEPENGFREISNIKSRCSSVYWDKYKDSQCPCREELREASHSLVGQWISKSEPIGLDGNWVIYLSVTSPEITPKEIFFAARNKLTKDTALAFLHFMRHLSYEGGSCIREVNFPCAMNWELVQLNGFVRGSNTYMFPRLRANKVVFDADEMNMEEFPAISRFFSHCRNIEGLTLSRRGGFTGMLANICSGNKCNSGERVRVKRS